MKSTKSHPQKPEEKILTAASREFAQFGLAGARVDRIASRSGINKAMIYSYFRSKENLYQTILNRHFDEIGQLLEENLKAEDSFESVFSKLAQAYNLIFENQSEFVPIILREAASGGERMKRALTRLLMEKGLVSKLKGIIDKGKKEGRFRNVDSRQAIISFVGMNIYYLIMSPLVNSVLEIKDEKKFRQRRQKEVVDLFLHGLEVK
ncbi:MAG TPA: TetR/AcrR family transcriptional regulator [candidate division Zixibacteria bacterium]